MVVVEDWDDCECYVALFGFAHVDTTLLLLPVLLVAS